MKIAVTGTTGIVGRFLASDLREKGHQVETLPGWRLGQPAPLKGCDALIHAGFAHLPGRYRGGEGEDPAGFIAANLDGSLRLFHEAKAAGVTQVIFMSSRAVYDGLPPGTALPDGTPPAPASLYGRVKAEAEAGLYALSAPGFRGASLRATGIFGVGRANKWHGLFADFLAGRPIAPRVATELHIRDMADAVSRLLKGADGAFNASDLLLDRRDLLGHVAGLTGCRHPLPERADPAEVSVMSCERLAGLGWQPCGWGHLIGDLTSMLPGAAVFEWD